MPFFKQSDEPPASRKSLRRQGKASPCVYCLAASSVFVKRQNLSTPCFPCAAEKLTTRWPSFSRRSRSVPSLHKAARPETRDCVSRCSVALHTASHRLAERNRFAPCYVGPRRSGQSLLSQRLPSAGPTLPWECQKAIASTRLSVQAPVHRSASHQPHQDGSLPRPTALPPMPFVSGYSHGYRRRCIRPQTAQAI